MRISKELRAKLDTMIDIKFNDRLETIISKIDELTDIQRQTLDDSKEVKILELIELINSNPYFKNYAEYYSNSVASFVRSNLSRLLNGESNFRCYQTDEIKELNLEYTKLKTEKEILKRDVIIKIEYTKDLSDLKQIFEEFGLIF